MADVVAGTLGSEGAVVALHPGRALQAFLRGTAGWLESCRWGGEAEVERLRPAFLSTTRLTMGRDWCRSPEGGHGAL